MMRQPKNPKATDRRAKSAAHAAGRRAETKAAWLLRLKGYRILARNYRVRHGEIDLIACRGRMLVFVEVKHRPDAQTAQGAITPRQWHRIGAAAARFCAGRRDLRTHVWRFDVVLCPARGWPRHIKDCWRAS